MYMMKMRRLSIMVTALTATMCAVPAQAEWQRAASKHFIVYADSSEEKLRTLTTRLERFDGILRYLHAMPDLPQVDANRVTIFVTRDVETVQKLCLCGNAAGFYVPRASGSIAFTPARSGTGIDDLKPQIVLFHEYAHHFLLSNLAAAYPAWFSEGFAEFAGTTRMEQDFAWVGVGAQHRGYGIFNNSVTAQMLFSPAGRRFTAEQMDEVYGRGWLLTHYMLFDRERHKQLTEYLRLINTGTPSLEAATKTFGDLKALDRAIDIYIRKSKLPALRVPYAKLPALAPIEIRPLTAGERALIDERMVSVRGVDDKVAPKLYAAARAAVAPYPSDPTAQGWLAEMAFDAGDPAAAEAAADRALAADARSVQALLYKARIHLRRAQEAKTADAGVWREARSWIVRANRLENDNAAALELYFESFGIEGIPPSKPAVAGLKRAFELVPQDTGLRFSVVTQDIADGDIDSAKRTLRPLAYDPHAGPDSRAAKLMAALDTGKTKEAAMAALAEASKTSD